ncbi:MAG: ATP-binding protein [Pseudomonadota bacterium]
MASLSDSLNTSEDKAADLAETSTAKSGMFAGLSDRLSRIVTDLGGYLTPKGLYARSVIIVIAPIVVLESVIAFIFMERHWEAVTRRLSEATARDIAAVISVYENFDVRKLADQAPLIEMARDKLNLSLQILPSTELPPALPRPFFDVLDRALSKEIARHVGRPFWIDTVGQSRHVEIRVKHDNAVLRFTARRSQTYASNSHIFLVWMVVTSLILVTVAIMFMRNQIRPILRLSQAADAFGKGRTIPEDSLFRGAREVRQAAQAFAEMRERITTHVEQRTAMLAGVSHDLRTILTRFKLELALLEDSQTVESLRADVNEMQQMLEGYLSFARGAGEETATSTNLNELLREVRDDAKLLDLQINLRFRKRQRDIVLQLKRQAFKRAITNLVSNASRFSTKVEIRAAIERRWVRIEVDDNGPGIPPDEHANVFRPFYRLDHARNQDTGNSGLGLAITRDVVRSHGGTITLGSSSMGGLRAVISLPI